MSSTATSGGHPAHTFPVDDAPRTPRLGFKRHLRVVVAPDEQVYLFGERGLTVLAGRTVAAIAPLLDGSRDLPALLADLPGDIATDQITAALSELAEAGVLTVLFEPSGADDRALAYWDAADLDAASAATAVTNGTVAVVGVGEVATSDTVGALRAAGLAVLAPGHPDTSLTVVLCADYLDPELAEIDEAARRTGTPWLLARPIGAIVWLGPVFEPGTSACWHCLAEPLSRHRDAQALARAELGDQRLSAPAATVPALRAAAANLIALESTKWIAGQRHRNQRAVWTFDSVDLTGRHHVLRHRPQCPACGDPALMRARAHRPVELVPRANESGHRALSVERMWERHRHLVSPITGVIKEVRQDEHGPAFFNSFRSGANLATRARDLADLRFGMRNVNGGKGTTALAARVGALCEAVERHSATFHGDEERIRGSLRTLGEQAIHPNACQLFHERQYATRHAWNARHSAFQHVDEPFEERTVTDWTPVWSMTQRRHRLIPTGLLYYGAPAEPGGVRLLADSNGNAAGATLEDAVLHGLLELVERDAVALWWYNRGRVPGVDLDGLADPWIEDLHSVYAGLDREVWVLDLTSDLAVPAMVAVSRRTDRSTEDIMFGFGAHLDPRIAVRRALTELNQLMPGLLRVASLPLRRTDLDPDLLRWRRDATTANQPYLLPDPDRAPRRITDYERTPGQDIRAEVELLRHRLESHDLEVLVLDQTRPDVGLPVVKVIVPGARHFWARLAPGRLYDVPVTLGRQREPTRYEDLNPYPMFL